MQKSMNAKANSPNRKATIEEGEAFSAMNSCAPRAADCQRQLDKSATDRQPSKSSHDQSHYYGYIDLDASFCAGVRAAYLVLFRVEAGEDHVCRDGLVAAEHLTDIFGRERVEQRRPLRHLRR